MQKRNLGGVFACTDINWAGKCMYTVYPLHQCVAIGSGWAGQISSFGPDQCTECIAYGYDSCPLIVYPSLIVAFLTGPRIARLVRAMTSSGSSSIPAM